METTIGFENIKLVLQHGFGFIISKVMFTAAELGVFDLLRESGEVLTSAAIAERLGTSHVGMERLLETCVGLKLLRVEKKDGEALYGNTDVSNLCLAKSSPRSQYPSMMYSSEVSFSNVLYMTDAVREGKNQMEKIYASPSNDIFAGFYRSKQDMKKFLDTMNSVWVLNGNEMMSAFDLSCFPLICDVGGGGCALAKECVSLYPNSTVTIFDLPKVIETAKKHYVSSEEHRITFHKGDFFKDPVPEADLYVLSRILHDWNDEKCVCLLTSLYKFCKPGGGVLIVEILLNEDRSGPLEAHLQSMMMLIHTEGKERTPSEYNALLSAAGFKEIQFKKGSIYSAILGRK
ncbi:acetylserotonin O-methyltransferase-like [Sceloporus undulatus]|uniref:acetylserotonin O-methyltransferase-like n=1 Tax=Sceloporus undulatus TaxID=8520 RepID=UPI001C4DAB2C|nr:acetylserotonin O-methyltransferase-like [Sceloporus undulatus]